MVTLMLCRWPLRRKSSTFLHNCRLVLLLLLLFRHCKSCL